MKRLLYILAMALALTGCADNFVEVATPPSTDGMGIGQMVLFSSGTTENNVTRASANTYYMPDAYHFVCRMYYKAQTGSEKFDVSGNTDQTTWMKVSGNIGNSLYWNKQYAEVTKDAEGNYIKGPGGVDDYGNDYGATAFYWQNRKEHAFLAWTDLNKARNMVGGDTEGTLKFLKDMDYRVYSNEMVQMWELDYYEIYGLTQKFANQEEMEEYVRAHGRETTFTTAQTALETAKGWSWAKDQYHYRHGKQYKYSRQHVETVNETTTSRDDQWYQEFMYFETIAYEPDDTEDKVMSTDPGMSYIIAYLKKNGVYVAKAEYNSETRTYTYFKTDEYGNLIYNEENPEFTFYFSAHYVKKERKKYDDYACNRFDLTKGDKTSMAEQPDIAQALTLQAPSGATQEANRVNLYFKHQFSQVQVNVKNSADNSVVLKKGDIQKVELLGVTKEGYVFTDLDEDGSVHPAAYEEIDFSKFNEDQLKDNPYGTAFEMFDMYDRSKYKDDAEAEADNWGYAPGYLKSFNCITFGQLQAIRITWQETGDGHTIHASTFRIPNTELVNLKSGMRYIWNIEVRRGTLAIIRTEIVDWVVPEDEPHNGSTDGTIQN